LGGGGWLAHGDELAYGGGRTDRDTNLILLVSRAKRWALHGFALVGHIFEASSSTLSSTGASPERETSTMQCKYSLLWCRGGGGLARGSRRSAGWNGGSSAQSESPKPHEQLQPPARRRRAKRSHAVALPTGSGPAAMREVGAALAGPPPRGLSSPAPLRAPAH
jgi:hypothetical protein